MHFAAKRTKSREKYGLFHRKVVKSTFDSEVSFSLRQTSARIDYLRASGWLVDKNLDFCVKNIAEYFTKRRIPNRFRPKSGQTNKKFQLKQTISNEEKPECAKEKQNEAQALKTVLLAIISKTNQKHCAKQAIMRHKHHPKTTLKTEKAPYRKRKRANSKA